MLRLLQWVVFEAVAIWYVMAYAAKVKRDPATLGGGRGGLKCSTPKQTKNAPLTPSGARSFWRSLPGAFLVMIYGVIPFADMGLPLPSLGWWFPELSALFLGGGAALSGSERVAGGRWWRPLWPAARDFPGRGLIIGITRGIPC